MLYVGSVTSTKTGTRPFWTIGLTVVGKPAATVITSSPGPQLPVAQPRRGQRAQRDEVRRRAGVDEDRVPHAEEAREVALERLRVAAGRQPELEPRVDEELQLGRVEDPPGHGDGRHARHEDGRAEGELVVLGDELQDGVPAILELAGLVQLSRHAHPGTSGTTRSCARGPARGRTRGSSRARAGPSRGRGTGPGSRSARCPGRSGSRSLRPTCARISATISLTVTCAEFEKLNASPASSGCACSRCARCMLAAAPSST